MKTEKITLEKLQASSALTVEQAIELTVETIISHHVRDAQQPSTTFGRVALDVHRSWAVDANLYVTFTPGARLSEEQTIYEISPKVEISWSSTGRTVAGAQASIALYQELVNVAALIEARLTEQKIYQVW